MGLPSFLLPPMESEGSRLPPINSLDLYGMSDKRSLPPLGFAIHLHGQSHPSLPFPMAREFGNSVNVGEPRFNPVTPAPIGRNVFSDVLAYRPGAMSTSPSIGVYSSPSDKLTNLCDVAIKSPIVKSDSFKSESDLYLRSLSEPESKSSSSEPNRKERKNKVWKPRKKKECPECHLFFSNLATHKSTHLKPTSRPHVCQYCNRGFARPNDLFRHKKCHWKETGSDQGQFKCPYKNHEKGDFCSHSSGIFSRCDTFKNHLRAIHFQYPQGTKKDQRNNVSGSCKMCNKHFSNVDDWLTNHIEKGECHIMM